MLATQHLADADSTAAVIGQAVGALLLFTLGLLLLLKGLKMRRDASVPAPAATWSPAPPPASPSGDAPAWALPPATVLPSHGSAPGPAPVQAGSTGGGKAVAYVVGGSLLLLGGVGNAAQQVVNRTPKRVILHPAAVLGLDLNDAASATAGAQVLASLPRELGQSSVQVFGDPAQLVAIVGIGSLKDQTRQLASFRNGFTSSAAATAPTDVRTVSAGSLGGTGQCFGTVIQGNPLQVCAFADGGSLVAVLDITGTTDSAGDRALAVRGAVLAKG